jgi:hypothetical protein
MGHIHLARNTTIRSLLGDQAGADFELPLVLSAVHAAEQVGVEGTALPIIVLHGIESEQADVLGGEL